VYTITEEELTMVKDYILLPFLLTILERDLNAIDQSTVKFRETYKRFIRCKMENVTKDLGNIRKEFRKRNIKVYNEKRNENGVEYTYLCRGYHSNFRMLWPTVKAYTEEKLEFYFRLKKEIQ
jgi:hypothetical protein